MMRIILNPSTVLSLRSHILYYTSNEIASAGQYDSNKQLFPCIFMLPAGNVPIDTAVIMCYNINIFEGRVRFLTGSKGNTAQRMYRRCAVRFFARLYRKPDSELTPVKGFLCRMAENMQAETVHSQSRSLCGVAYSLRAAKAADPVRFRSRRYSPDERRCCVKYAYCQSPGVPGIFCFQEAFYDS